MLIAKNILPQTKILLIFLFFTINPSAYAADNEKFKPFILAEQIEMTMDEAKVKLSKQIKQSPFEIIAEYSPYDDAYIYIISNDALKTLASESHYGGFAAPQRISLTLYEGKMQIAYTNPVYMQYAYRMANVNFQPILDDMKQAFGFKIFFGGEGLTARKLKRYKYSFGLEDFDSFYELPSYDSFEEASEALEQGFAERNNGISQVYKIKIPGKEQAVYGISMNAKDSGIEELDTRSTMNIIDYLPLKRTAYLPYEIMVDGKNIIALHARFRIASYFYDLKMFGKHGFGQLFSTPSAYYKAFSKASGEVPEENRPPQNGFID